ncbi:MAG: CDP-diacylglycerol--glycerol-3-phosphate 3-phosphatidyltransferase [Candidatus Omnitrophica bacterium]|nr:CDP-diacylglycerol--glycerol-3-phosphate 3-phosphatidyltransferase [Candidatus Omnitrophota bacterium]
MNLANQLTISRIFLTFVFMAFLFSGGVAAKAMALATFLIASFTDFLDGFIAKHLNMTSDFGKLMDPIADKILVLAAFLAFVEMKLVPAWMVLVIVLREVTVTGLRIAALGKHRVIAADYGGKHKMVSQVLSILAILFFIILREGGIKIFKFWTPETENGYKDAIFLLMSITVILTIISGASYLLKNKEVWTNVKKD